MVELSWHLHQPESYQLSQPKVSLDPGAVPGALYTVMHHNRYGGDNNFLNFHSDHEMCELALSLCQSTTDTVSTTVQHNQHSSHQHQPTAIESWTDNIGTPLCSPWIHWETRWRPFHRAMHCWTNSRYMDIVVDIFYVYCPWIITLAWLTWQALDPTWMTWETDRRWEDAWAKGWCWRKSESDYSLFSKQRNWPWFPRSFSCSYEEDCVAPVRTSLEWEVGGGFRLHAESSSVCRNLKKNKTTH